MNERILKLAEQSGLYHRLATGSLYPSAMTAEECSIAYEKFAELILQECYNVLSEWKKEPFPFDENIAIDIIKDHFR